jgi:CBS domain containing-hemolysin-like protein
MPVIDLMNAFMEAKTSIAYVEENGRTIGIIALEDILEEVFGEIEDEHD